MATFAFSGAGSAAFGAPGRAPRSRARVADWAASSEAGLAREYNEDCWRVVPDPGLLLVADGMGGHDAGEVASAIAVDTVAAWDFDDQFAVRSDRAGGDPLEQIAQAVSAANASILAAAARRPECLGMGATLAVAWIRGSRLFHAHVGDARICLVRGGRLLRLTRDHSLGQAMADAGVGRGDGGLQPSLRGMLTRALGVEPVVEADFGEVALEPGDRVLLCTDGVSDALDDALILELAGRKAPARDIVDAMLEAARRAGSLDDVTALLAVCDGGEECA